MVNEYHEENNNNMSIERSQEGSGVQVWVLLEYEFSNAPGVPDPSLVTQEICSERVYGVQGDKMNCRRNFVKCFLKLPHQDVLQFACLPRSAR